MRKSLLIAVMLQSAILCSVCEEERHRYSPLEKLEIGTLSEHNLSSQAGEIFLGSCTQEDFYDWYTDEITEECRYFLSNTTLVRKYMLYCEEDCGWLYFEFLRSCGELGELLVSFFEELCWMNRKGVPCYYFLTSDKYTGIENEVHQLCFPRNATCPTVCRNALESLSHKLGCCVNNIFNTTVPSDITQHALWSSCGVSTPLFCEDVIYEDEQDEDREDEDYEETDDFEDDGGNEGEESADMEDRADSEHEAKDGKNSGRRVAVYKSFLVATLFTVITVAF